jgi:hypothetical protein
MIDPKTAHPVVAALREAADAIEADESILADWEIAIDPLRFSPRMREVKARFEYRDAPIPSRTCGTCKFFSEKEPDDIYPPTGYHVCGWLQHAVEIGKAPQPSAVLVDASDYYAALCVKEDFGCNQWEPK